MWWENFTLQTASEYLSIYDHSWYFYTCFKGDTGLDEPPGLAGIIGPHGMTGPSGKRADCWAGGNQFLSDSLVFKLHFLFLHN